jgi:hypothetical protein
MTYKVLAKLPVIFYNDVNFREVYGPYVKGF